MDLSNTSAPAPGPWSRRRRLTLGFTAIALVAGGGVAIAAGSADTTDSTPEATTSVAKPVAGKSAFGGVLHSESVVSDGNGGYVTHLTQAGKVESVDAGNLTVVSEDGYKRSWSRTDDTVVGGGGWSVTKNDDGSYTVKKDSADLAAGDQVVVMGTLKGDEATAQRIAQRPEGGEIPGMIMKRFGDEFGGEFGDRAEAVPGLKDQMLQRFEGGPGGEVRRFDFRTGPGDEGVPEIKPAPVPDTAVPSAESSAFITGSASLT